MSYTRLTMPLLLAFMLAACSQLGPTLAPAALPDGRQAFSIGTLPSQRVMVALVFGQSNSANSGRVLRNAGENVYNFYQGKLYEAQDPLLGATGSGGSVWTRLGRKLSASQEYDAVVFVAIGVSGSEIARWTPGGDLHPRVLGTIRDLKSQGLSVTHLLWHQGEAEALVGTDKEAYKERFLRMLASIRSQGVEAPIYVSTATRCKDRGPNEQIRQAQTELVDTARGIYTGPDTDALGPLYRFDACHFSDEGLGKFADLWLEKLSPVGVKTPQHILFDLPNLSKTQGDAPFSVAPYAAASSGLAVSFSSRTTTRCTVTPDGTVTLVAAGTCTLGASQAGDDTYAAAEPVNQTLAVSADPTLGPRADTYLMNFEQTPTNRLVYGVRSGSGVVHQKGDNPKTSTIPVIGQRRQGAQLLRARHAKVVSLYGSKRLTVVSPHTNTPSPQGGRIRLRFAPHLNPAGVTLTSLTLSNLTTGGAYLRFFHVGGGSSLQRLEVTAAGDTRVVPLDVAGVRAVDIYARNAYAVDDVAFTDETPQN